MYLYSLRNEFDVIVENYERTSERFSLEESYDRAVCVRETGQNTKCSGFCSVYLKRGDQFNAAFFANT